MARIQKSKNEIYIESLYSEDEILKTIRDSVNGKLRSIQIGTIEANIIKILLKAINAKKVLEIGTLAGYSTLVIARALGKGGKVISVEKSQANYNIALGNLGSLPEFINIELVNADAKIYLENLKGKFDAIFIDANKASYPYYFIKSAKLLRKGGLLIADNSLLGGQISGKKALTFDKKIVDSMKIFSEMIRDDKNFESIIIPTPEGLTVALRLSD